MLLVRSVLRTNYVVPALVRLLSTKAVPVSTKVVPITTIDTPEKGAQLAKQLIELGRPVAWTVQRHKEAATLSAYAGDKLDFGNGPHIFIDDVKKYAPVLEYFKNDRCRKIWYGYSDSVRALKTMTVEPNGYGGDVLDMARMMDKRWARLDIKSLMNTLPQTWRKNKLKSLSMIDPGGERQWEGGTVITEDWKRQACLDSAVVFESYEQITGKLRELKVNGTAIAQNCGDRNLKFSKVDTFNALQAYNSFYRPLSELLYEIEMEGIWADPERLEKILKERGDKKEQYRKAFVNWASDYCDDAHSIDLKSTRQVQHLLFAPCTNLYNKTTNLPAEFKMKKNIQTKEITLQGAGLKADAYTAAGWPSTNTAALVLAVEKNAEAANVIRFILDVQKAGGLGPFLEDRLGGQQRYEDFLKWARKYCKDAELIDLGSTKQVKQLLFSPCQNSKNKTQKMPNELKVQAKVIGKETVIRGAQLKAKVYTKAGWPSTSMEGLEKAAELNEKEAADALRNLAELQRSQRSFEKQAEELKSLVSERKIHSPHLLHHSKNVFMNSASTKQYASLLRQCFGPMKDEIMVMIHYPQLELRALARLAGCPSLTGRLAKSDPTQLLAEVMFAHTQQPGDGSFKNRFSKEYAIAEGVDVCARRGGDSHELVRLIKCTSEEAEGYLQHWKSLHAAANSWAHEQASRINEKGFVESLQGRVMKTSKKSMQNGLQYVIRQSGNELLGERAMKLRNDEALSVLGWRVIWLEHELIIVKAPASASHSIDKVKEIFGEDGEAVYEMRGSSGADKSAPEGREEVSSSVR